MTDAGAPVVLVEVVVPVPPQEVELGIPGPPGPPGQSEAGEYDTDLALIYQTAKL
ncbi:MAG: hypothetical protein H3C26_07285 [Rhodocyclaceae bacterium]|nr:hypothetical protein [Rhodocyclaceae bacterium]